MPGIDGFDAIPRIRQICPDIAIIMISSDDRPGDATLSQNLKLAGYTTKPVRRSELLRLIAQALSVSPDRLPEAAISKVSPETLSGRKLQLLVAEDSEDNRFLIEAYLKNGPYEITFAEDGRQAVEFFHSQVFDLVLMDLQMPAMDGLTATRMIRAEEQSRNLAPTPILALTANARSEDVQASQSAGCNSHLSKPISKQKLISAIEEWKKPADAQRSAPTYHVELPQGLEEYATKYLKRRREEVALLDELLKKLDFQQLRALAHNMKGNGSSFGFPDLTRLGAALESSARKEDVQQISASLQELSNYIEYAWKRLDSLAPKAS